jgi:hypothetical protein
VVPQSQSVSLVQLALTHFLVPLISRQTKLPWQSLSLAHVW